MIEKAFKVVYSKESSTKEILVCAPTMIAAIKVFGHNFPNCEIIAVTVTNKEIVYNDR